MELCRRCSLDQFLVTRISLAETRHPFAVPAWLSSQLVVSIAGIIAAKLEMCIVAGWHKARSRGGPKPSAAVAAECARSARGQLAGEVTVSDLEAKPQLVWAGSASPPVPELSEHSPRSEAAGPAAAASMHRSSDAGSSSPGSRARSDLPAQKRGDAKPSLALRFKDNLADFWDTLKPADRRRILREAGYAHPASMPTIRNAVAIPKAVRQSDAGVSTPNDSEAADTGSAFSGEGAAGCVEPSSPEPPHARSWKEGAGKRRGAGSLMGRSEAAKSDLEMASVDVPLLHAPGRVVVDALFWHTLDQAVGQMRSSALPAALAHRLRQEWADQQVMDLLMSERPQVGSGGKKQSKGKARAKSGATAVSAPAAAERGDTGAAAAAAAAAASAPLAARAGTAAATGSSWAAAAAFSGPSSTPAPAAMPAAAAAAAAKPPLPSTTASATPEDAGEWQVAGVKKSKRKPKSSQARRASSLTTSPSRAGSGTSDQTQSSPQARSSRQKSGSFTGKALPRTWVSVAADLQPSEATPPDSLDAAELPPALHTRSVSFSGPRQSGLVTDPPAPPAGAGDAARNWSTDAQSVTTSLAAPDRVLSAGAAESSASSTSHSRPTRPAYAAQVPATSPPSRKARPVPKYPATPMMQPGAWGGLAMNHSIMASLHGVDLDSAAADAVSPCTQRPLWLEGRLHAELVEFVQWCVEDAGERRADELACIGAAAHIIANAFPASSVELFGSFVTGLAVPSSDVDMLVLTHDSRKKANAAHPNANPQFSRQFGVLASELRAKPWAVEVTAIPTAQVPVIKLVADPAQLGRPRGSKAQPGTARSSLVRLDITFASLAHRGKRTTELACRLAAFFPALSPLVLCIKQLTAAAGLNDAFSGGLSSYCILLIVLCFLQTRQPFLVWAVPEERSPLRSHGSTAVPAAMLRHTATLDDAAMTATMAAVASPPLEPLVAYLQQAEPQLAPAAPRPLPDSAVDLHSSSPEAFSVAEHAGVHEARIAPGESGAAQVPGYAAPPGSQDGAQGTPPFLPVDHGAGHRVPPLPGMGAIDTAPPAPAAGGARPSAPSPPHSIPFPFMPPAGGSTPGIPAHITPTSQAHSAMVGEQLQARAAAAAELPQPPPDPAAP